MRYDWSLQMAALRLGMTPETLAAAQQQQLASVAAAHQHYEAQQHQLLQRSSVIGQAQAYVTSR